MKLQIAVLSLGLLGSFAASVSAQTPPEYSPALPAGAGKNSVDSTPALTRTEALKIIAEARHYVAHPGAKPEGKVTEPEVITPDFDMIAPPPPPRVESKVASPGANYVWVPGHYMPVKGEWRWVRGEWAVPATPISVWIVARYDEKSKKWAPGYWQPDVPAATPGTTTAPSTASPNDAPPVAPAPRY